MLGAVCFSVFHGRGLGIPVKYPLKVGDGVITQETGHFRDAHGGGGQKLPCAAYTGHVDIFIDRKAGGFLEDTAQIAFVYIKLSGHGFQGQVLTVVFRDIGGCIIHKPVLGLGGYRKPG